MNMNQRPLVSKGRNFYKIFRAERDCCVLPTMGEKHTTVLARQRPFSLKQNHPRIPDYLGLQHTVHLYRKVPDIK